MGVYIPNMNMPTSCEKCPFTCEALQFFNGKGRPQSCPLIEIIPCKECKNSHMTYDGKCKYCDWEKDDDDNYIECYFDGNHFCSYAERK